MLRLLQQGRSLARIRYASLRHYAVDSIPPKSPQTSFEKILRRTPKFLRPTVQGLRDAPMTHITAFLLLHEVTAIIPLFGLTGAFHYYNWLPPYFAEGTWVVAGVEKFGRYFRKKGWIGSSEEAEAERKAHEGKNAREIEETTGLKWWNRGEGSVRIVVEFATAYAVVKALLPLRLGISVWGAPWFAKWTVIPVRDGMKRIWTRKAAATTSKSPVADTNATGGKST